MKKIRLAAFSSLLLITLSSPLFAPPVLFAADKLPAFSWAQSAGGNGADRGNGVAHDQQGNVIVVGFFSETATFAPGVQLTSAGGADGFVAKYTSAGTLLWVKPIQSLGEETARSVTTDRQNNILVTGSFADTTVFAPGVTLTSVGSTDVFLAKYTPGGELLWVRQAGGAGPEDFAFKVAVNSRGQAFITGLFTEEATFAPGLTLTSAGDTDMFLAKYDTDGNLLWAQQAGGVDHEEGVGVSIGADGRVYVAGIFAATATFAPGVDLTSAGEWDGFFAVYNTHGELLLAKSVGGPGFDEGYAAVRNKRGDIVLVGTFENDATFAPGATLTSAGDTDAFLATYDRTGTLRWATSLGGPEFDQAREVTVRQSGDIYLGGRFRNTAFFAPGVSRTSLGGDDIFVARYTLNGDLRWVKQAGGLGNDRTFAITTKDEKVYITGSFTGTAAFDNATLTSVGGSDLFLSQLR